MFLKCLGAECITFEGGERSLFLKLNKELDWGEVPEQPKEISPVPAKTVAQRKESLPRLIFSAGIF